MSSRRFRAFTLIELTAVIAILAILAVVLVPTIGAVMDDARKSVATSNLRQIAQAYATYSLQGGTPRTINASSVHDWARVLAQEVNFNDARIYILAEDPLVELQTGGIPRVVAKPGTGESWDLDAEFDGFPVSYAVANRLSTRAPASTTPLAWTRGLQSDGTWRPATDATPGVYGDEGGHIVFLDAHVRYFRQIGGELTDYDSKNETSNVADALSPNAQVLEYTAP